MSSRGIYTDLLREFLDRGDDVYVVCPSERREGKSTELTIEDGVAVLRVKVGNITEVSLVEKTISTLLIEHQFVTAIRRFFGGIRFDLVIYPTPPVTFDRVVRYVKNRDGCRSYLLLKDIFPQNAVDLDLMKKGGLVWRYFRSRERRLYAQSDFIGCMSPANARYLLAHNDNIAATKVEVCPNSIKPRPSEHLRSTGPSIRDLYGIPQDAMVLAYGGNLGKPQGIGFLLEVLDRSKDRQDVFFLIVGSGTDYCRIEQCLKTGRHRNARLLRTLPKDQYDELLTQCDVGLILLDRRFSIPNFPSRMLAYMEAALPILAATDSHTDIRSVVCESSLGLWVHHGDIDGFMAAIDRLYSDKALRCEMGARGRAYLEEHYTVAKSCEMIRAHITGER